MRRIFFIWLLGAAMLQGCSEQPRRHEITYPTDFADTQACQAQCKNNNKVALALGEVCINQCEISFERGKSDCDQFAGKDETRWKACRLQALDKYAACQDTCAASVRLIAQEYDQCMKECQSEAAKE
jgi:hypothetical protein